MIKAKTTIIVGDTSYSEGQAVKGLAKTDVRWMKNAGYIEDVKEDRKTESSKTEGSKKTEAGDGV